MAIYHLSVKTISRSAGRSATAAAAYRAGSKITDESSGVVFDYTRKKGVEFTDIAVPADAPDWALDSEKLWNAAERAEKRKNSTVAREFEIALPAELSADERQRLAQDFALELVQQHGCAAEVSIHAPAADGDNRNHHAHILLTTRRLTADGFTEKTRELDDQKKGAEWVTQWRERFAALQNERLRDAGVTELVDHRSHADRGLDVEPSQHLGVAAIGVERRAKRKAQQAGLSPDQIRASPSELRLRHQREKREREAKKTELAAQAAAQAEDIERDLAELKLLRMQLTEAEAIKEQERLLAAQRQLAEIEEIVFDEPEPKPLEAAQNEPDEPEDEDDEDYCDLSM